MPNKNQRTIIRLPCGNYINPADVSRVVLDSKRGTKKTVLVMRDEQAAFFFEGDCRDSLAAIVNGGSCPGKSCPISRVKPLASKL